MDEAIDLLKRGDAAAAAALQSLVLSDPHDPVALANLGMALQQQHRHADAEAAYRRALVLAPGHPEARFNLGTALLAQGHHDDAAASFRQAAAAGAGLPHVRAAAVLARLVAEVRPHPADAAAPPVEDAATALVRRGLLLRAQGHGPASTRCFHEALALDPAHGPAAYCAGEDCVWTGRLAEARHDLAIALRWALDAWRPAEPAAAAAAPDGAFDKASARIALFAVLDALAGAGIDAFLNGGTALGCVRDGDFIGFDSDVDVGVLPGADPADIIDAIDAHPHLEYRYHDVYKDAVLRVRFGTPGGVGGDVFLYQQDDHGLWCGVQRGPHALRWRDTAFALRPTLFLGRRVLLPDPAPRYLAENYGPAWIVPDPDHLPGFSAPNLIDSASPLVRCTIYLCIVEALRRGQPGPVLRHCAEAVARFPDDALLADLLATALARAG